MYPSTDKYRMNIGKGRGKIGWGEEIELKKEGLNWDEEEEERRR